ncbi:MAG: hypothetical protein EPN93_21080 [Spirochaetes bacterium]|nr:MAG: hypothetical protein EPN93_21080 [Spirochaetota bacterium]
MKRIFTAIALAFIAACIGSMAALPCAAEDASPRGRLDKGAQGKPLGPDERIDPAREEGEGADEWYTRLGASAGYYRMGPEIENALGQIEDFFSGKDVRLSAVNFDTTVTMTARDSVKRARTSVLPMTELGLGHGRGRHRFELSLGLAGMVKLNTIDADTGMTIHEEVKPDIDDCPMAKLGFVDPVSGNGDYRLQMVLNEEVWILSPTFTYDYSFFQAPWGMLTAGTSLSLMILTLKQDIRFRARRTDISADPYSERLLEGSVQSTAVNDAGVRLQAYCGYRKYFSDSCTLDLRMGVSAGFVDVHRDVDGASTIYMGGDVMPISFPLSSITVDGKPFKTRETNRVQLTGIFIQAGISI